MIILTKEICVVWLLLFSFALQAQGVPKIPSYCFRGKSYCTDSKVVKLKIEDSLKKIVRVNIFGELPADEYDSVDEIVKIFLDFDNWKEFSERDGSGAIIIKLSKKLPSIYQGEQEIYRQYINSYVRAPMPVSSLQIRSVSHYWMTEPLAGMLVSARFKHLKKGIFEIPGEDILRGGEGFKHFFGDLHITLDLSKKVYRIYFTTYIRPNFPFLLNIAKFYMEASILSVFRGMYGL